MASFKKTPAGGVPTEPEIKYVDTASAYDLWSTVYDTDNNFLQNLDTIEMKSLFPKLISILNSATSATVLAKPWRFVDLGCGTGRNTAHLVTLPPTDVSEIYALDLSPGMLELARKRLSKDDERVRFRVFDALNPAAGEAAPTNADAIISTLVLEHIPLKDYFTVAAGMLKVGGYLLLTNMHGDMGKISQAGFIEPLTGEKIRPVESYAYTCAEVLEEAERCGFEILGDSGFEERSVTESNHELFGPRAAKWIGVTVWFGGILRRVR
ncbi:S-adenosyl-L-methionine-dependent methyltransferase [Naviculisporaceae sp. PSN 640]